MTNEEAVKGMVIAKQALLLHNQGYLAACVEKGIKALEEKNAITS